MVVVVGVVVVVVVVVVVFVVFVVHKPLCPDALPLALAGVGGPLALAGVGGFGIAGMNFQHIRELHQAFNEHVRFGMTFRVSTLLATRCTARL